MVRTRAALISFIVISLLALMPASGATSVSWTRNAGTAVFGAAAGPHGVVYATGMRPVGITVEAMLIKYGPDGSRRWTRSWLPSQHASTRGVGVAVAPDGTVYVVGSVQGQCEAGGWFIRAYSPVGALRGAYVTPGWQCSLAQTVFGIAVNGSQVVVAGMDHGCCGDPTEDGWVRSFSRALAPTWSAPFEPPAPIPTSFFDRATGVAIGPSGSVFVSGWASTKAVPSSSEGVDSPGTVILEKLTPAGHVLWSRRPGVPVPGELGVISVAARAGRVMVTAPAGGLVPSFFWGPKIALSRIWLGRFTPHGALVRSWNWATKHKDAAEPLGVSIDAKLRTWVVGTQRDPSDGGLDAFVTTFGPAGRRIGQAQYRRHEVRAGNGDRDPVRCIRDRLHERQERRVEDGARVEVDRVGQRRASCRCWEDRLRWVSVTGSGMNSGTQDRRATRKTSSFVG